MFDHIDELKQFVEHNIVHNFVQKITDCLKKLNTEAIIILKTYCIVVQ